MHFQRKQAQLAASRVGVGQGARQGSLNLCPIHVRRRLSRSNSLARRDLKLGDAPIADDMPFFGTDVDLDSLDILLLMTSIEKQFKVKIPSEAVGKQIFQNVSTLAAYVDEQMAAGNAASPAAAEVSRSGTAQTPAAPGSIPASCSRGSSR